MYDRVSNFADHFVDLRKGIEKAVESYNKAAGSLETRVLVTARRFKDLGVTTGEDIKTPEPIEKSPRVLVSTENPDDERQVAYLKR